MPARTSLALAAAVLFHAAAARGAEVQINPVVIHLSPAARSEVVLVRNVSSDPVRFELQVRAWSQSRTGEMELAPSEDVVAYPPILALAPGEERNLRIAAATAFEATEKTYRVFLQELPPAERPQTQSQVRVLSRIGLPVFLAAARPVVRTAVKDLALSAGKASFVLRNDGNVHVRATAVMLAAVDAEGKPVLEKDLEAWYVLAGGERAYQLELPAANCPRVRALKVAVSIGPEQVKAEAPVAAGSCGK